MRQRHPVLLAIGLFVVATLLSCCGFGVYAVAVGSAPAPARQSVAVAMTGSVVLAADGRSLRYSTPPVCGFRSGIATSSPDAVTVVLSVLDATMCTEVGGVRMPLTTTIPLTEPLGDRKVVDATSGRTLPVYAERGALRPSGGRFGASMPYGDDGSLAPGFGGPGAATLGEAFRVSPGDRQTAVVWVIQTTGRWNRPPGVVTTAVTVRGHAGERAPGILVWAENGQTVAVLWQPGSPDQSPPPAIDLAEIATMLVRTAAS